MQLLVLVMFTAPRPWTSFRPLLVPRAAPCRLGLVALALALAPACLSPYGTTTGTGTDTDSDTGTSAVGTSSTTAFDPTTTAPLTSATTGAPTCGDGVVDASEQCDLGPDNADDGSCTLACKHAFCGDGLHNPAAEECDDGNNAGGDGCSPLCFHEQCGNRVVDPGEACDDGVNDGAYGGCSSDCTTPSPRCGDGTVDPRFEECDGDPGCLGTCAYAHTCLDVKTADPNAESGPYLVRRDGVADPVQVWCILDDSVDGGGYTLLKVDIDSDLNDFPYSAGKAETACAAYDMQLLVPRSQAHLQAAYAVATTENIAPVGGGIVTTGSDYLRILGIYPAMPSISCVDKAINSVDCPEWRASDMQAYWVSGAPIGTGEPDPDGACTGCSMSYTWNFDGSVKKYLAVPDFGGSSFRFLCDTGDKLP